MKKGIVRAKNAGDSPWQIVQNNISDRPVGIDNPIAKKEKHTKRKAVAGALDASSMDII